MRVPDLGVPDLGVLGAGADDLLTGFDTALVLIVQDHTSVLSNIMPRGEHAA
jgi:hypothetical protein